MKSLSLAQWGCALTGLFAALCAVESPARADIVQVTGTITQDLTDSGATAGSNPALEAIKDGDLYSVQLTFNGPILAPGVFSLTSVQFKDLTHPVVENAFISGSMTITQSSGVDTFSALGCLIDAVTCLAGNQLDLNFEIPSSGLNMTGVAASAVPGIFPSMDLLEDGGSSDIHGTVTSYGLVAAAPEPPARPILVAAAACILWRALRMKQRPSGKIL